MQLDQTINSFFKADYENIIAVYLFGSSVLDKKGRAGDVDIGLLFDPDAMDLASGCIDNLLVELPRVLRREIHPVIMNTAGEELLRQIFSKGRCLIVKDDKALAQFKMTAFARIADYNYYRKILQQGVIRSVSEGLSVG